MPKDQETTHDDNLLVNSNHLTEESLESLMGFRLKPRFNETINLLLIKKVIHDVHYETLQGKTWDDLDPKIACNEISVAINEGVKAVYQSIREDGRYKYMVQTFISKFHSQSLNLQTRCIWDPNTDRIVFDNFVNSYIICSSQVVFIYYY
ncbi:tctex1 domain-containing protein 2-like [Aphis craccivora]|uniref:Tctex1 domain-containing protein 2-like n=1 Tax=Aphis craccivora TaxID=307492 RepID=A0A6G0YTU2_APHCR|nr:tctex1 domain-containing protein 2-like [Aphis craccivora]